MPKLGQEIVFNELLFDQADEGFIQQIKDHNFESVLDIGCADGRALFALACRYHIKHLEGVEGRPYVG